MLFEQLEHYKTSLSGERLQALEAFLAQGFPTKKDEEYKYTHLKEITEKSYNFSASESHNISKKQLDLLHLGEDYFDFIVFVNGVLHPELSNISIDNVKYGFSQSACTPKFTKSSLCFTKLLKANCLQ